MRRYFFILVSIMDVVIRGLELGPDFISNVVTVRSYCTPDGEIHHSWECSRAGTWRIMGLSN